MKLYTLSISTQARDALQSYVDYIAIEKQLPQTAERWFEKAWNALQTLKTFPNRCQYAPENEFFDFPVRTLIVDSCLFLYTVDELRDRVLVFGFRHARQKPLTGE